MTIPALLVCTATNAFGAARDPQSHWLRECPVDVPWNDPELIEAMLEPARGESITAAI